SAYWKGLFPGSRSAKRIHGCIRVRFLGTFRPNREQIHSLSRSECRTIAKPIKTESTILRIETEKFCYILSLGFFQISVASLEKVTFPGQKVGTNACRCCQNIPLLTSGSNLGSAF